jgi:hypothetical protein
MAGRGKLIEGAAAAKAEAVSVPVPLRVRVSPVMTSTGATLSNRVRPMARVPRDNDLADLGGVIRGWRRLLGEGG